MHFWYFLSPPKLFPLFNFPSFNFGCPFLPNRLGSSPMVSISSCFLIPFTFLLLATSPRSSSAGLFGHQSCAHPLDIEEEKAHIHDGQIGHYEVNGSKGRYSANESVAGFVTSHGYPENYGNQKCSVELGTSPSSSLVIHLQFVDLDLEPRYSRSGQCLRDYLVITLIDRDGREHTSERICGQEHPEPVRSMQPRVRILFIASSSPSSAVHTIQRRRRGFRIRFEFVPEATILAPSSFYYDSDRRFIADCGGVNSPTDLSGEIRSPGFPFTYPRNVTCNWLLRVSPHHRLYIRLLDLELAPTVAECERASLQFFDGYHQDIDGEEVVAKLSHFQQPNRHRLGSTDAHFCGGSSYLEAEGMKSFLSEGNRVIVRFSTLGSPSPEQIQNYQTNGTPIGFRLVWTEVTALVLTRGDDPRLPTAEEPSHPSFVSADQCDGFVCGGGEFCVDVADAICVDRTRLCINETLRCDGVPNCAENDDSDESQCYSQDAVQMALVVLFLITFISIVSCLVVYAIRRIQRTRKERNENGRMKRKRKNDDEREQKRGEEEEKNKGRRERGEKEETKKRKRMRGGRRTPTIGWRSPSQMYSIEREQNGKGEKLDRMPGKDGEEPEPTRQRIATISNGRMEMDLMTGNGDLDGNGDLLPPCLCPHNGIENEEDDVWERRKSANGFC